MERQLEAKRKVTRDGQIGALREELRAALARPDVVEMFARLTR